MLVKKNSENNVKIVRASISFWTSRHKHMRNFSLVQQYVTQCKNNFSCIFWVEKETETVFPKGEKQQYQKCSVVDALKAASAALQSELERVSRWKSSVASKQTTEQHDLKCLITKKFEQI